jgi:hypothetical protein
MSAPRFEDIFTPGVNRQTILVQPDAAAAPTATVAAVAGKQHVIFGWEAYCDTATQTITETRNGKTMTFPIGVQTIVRDYDRPLVLPVNTAYSVGIATGSACKVLIRGITIPQTGQSVNVTSA